MNWPFALPDWLPWWVPLAVLLPALLYAIVFLLMPFSVFGLKGRLDSMEARLDEIQGEIRSLALRLPESGRRTSYEDAPVLPDRRRNRADEISPTPPIPPARAPDDSEWSDVRPRRRPRIEEQREERLSRPNRNEPRLGWPD